MTYQTLKKRRQQSIDQLLAAAESMSNKKDYSDDRFWNPLVDKSGNGYAVIRFLPSSSEGELPWAKYYEHSFQGPNGMWYIEKCLSSIGKDDPVNEHNTVLWNSGDDDKKNIARDRKRKLRYVSNVLVLKDPANSENEGKVFLFRYGAKIFEKIMDVMQPKFEDETPMNPFDLWEGADFKLKIRKYEGYRNYDRSEFDEPSAISGDDSELETIFNRCFELGEFTSPENYKTYEELKKRFSLVIGEVTESTNIPVASYSEPKSVQAKTETSVAETNETEDDEEDDTLSYFSKLAQEED
jgi:hypothetical protein